MRFKVYLRLYSEIEGSVLGWVMERGDGRVSINGVIEKIHVGLFCIIGAWLKWLNERIMLI